MKTKPTDFRDHIASDPGIHHGKPCIKGTRVPVHVVLDALAAGETWEEVMEDYAVTVGDVSACLAYAARLANEEILPMQALVKTE